MATIEIRMPAEEKEGTEASLGRWLKQRGDAVEEHEPLLEINTDKVTIEIPSPASGVLRTCGKTEGDTVLPGDLLGEIDTETSFWIRDGALIDDPSEDRPQAENVQALRAPGTGDGFSPAVRRLLQEHNLNPAEIPKIPKLSRGERLTTGDVEAYLAARTSALTPALSPYRTSGRRVPHTPMRKSISAHMTRSVQAAPHVTSVFEADLFAVLQDRETRKASAAGDPVPSITAYLIRAALQAIRHVPEVNSRWHEDHLEIFDWVNFGVGTALDTGGLVVPVLHHADALDLEQISNRLREITAKARKGKLTHADMAGGTFTLSNHGVSGSLLAAPIILPHGQVAILGAGKLQKRVIVCETGGRELFRVRPMMYVTLTVDHRVLDGQQTNGFLTKFVEALEHPAIDSNH